MKSEPTPSDREVLAGLVERVTKPERRERLLCHSDQGGVTVTWSPWLAMPPPSLLASGLRLGQRPHPWPAVQSPLSQDFRAHFCSKASRNTSPRADPRHRARLCQEAPAGRFVALSAARMKEWTASNVFGLDLLVIQIDGIHMKEDIILVAAIGVDARGDKHPLGLVATQNAASRSSPLAIYSHHNRPCAARLARGCRRGP
jgi:hypothetical protein